MKTQLGHYELIAELGRGGMGVVYKGYETSLNRYVAIKVFAESLAHDASVKERFLREARSMAALNDPHIIQIFFIGEDAGQTYFVMEFVEGESLGSLLKREGHLTPEQAAKVIYQTAQGLATAHDKGVIHRDIKPGNLMVTSKGNIKIADFGIALKAQDFSKKLTSTGEFVGTPGYLSPEVCLSKPVDQRSDIFSLGVVLFECLAGRMPFKDDSPLGLMLEVVNAQIPDVRALNADVDTELSLILTKMIAKDPGDRYQSCRELVIDLAKHPLVAKGGEIPLQTLPPPAAATMVGAKTPLSGQRALPNTSPTPRSLPSVRAIPGAALASVSSATTHMAERSTQVVKRSHNRRNAAIAAAAIGLVAVTGWAYRDRLAAGAFGAHADVSSVAGTVSAKSLNTGSSNGSATNTKIGATPAPALGPGNNYQSNASKTSETSASDEESVPDDALWLADVPDAFLKGNAYNDFVAALPLPDDTEQGTHSAIYSASNAYSPALLPAGQALVSSGVPIAWHFGYSFGFGVGWYNYVYPRQVYIGPVRQIAFVGSRPAPVAVPFRTNDPLPSAAQALQVSNTAVIPSRPLASAPAQTVAFASSRPTSSSNLSAPAVNAHAPTASPAAAHPVSTPFIPARGANVSRPAFGAPSAPTVASVSRPAVAWAPSARVASPAQQRPQRALANGPDSYASESRSQAIRSDQRHNQALMAESAQRREVALANQNARRAAAAEAKAVQAQRVRAARERKDKRHPG